MKIENKMTKDKLIQLKKEMKESLNIDLYQLVVNYPFCGGIAIRLKMIPVRDSRLNTACTDGNCIYVDMSFYKSLTNKERCFVIAHEVWHCIMLHFFRKQTRDTNIFNIAADMEVNRIILDSCNTEICQNPKSALFPPKKLWNSSAEDIYEELMTNENKNNLPDYKFDKHIYNSDQSGLNQDGDNSDSYSNKDEWGEKGEDPDYKPSINSETSERIREYVISEYEKCKQMGNLPDNIKNIIDSYKRPEIKWQDELAKFVTSVYGDSRKWLPPNRRHIYEDMYFQSRRAQRINVVVAIDTSGSCNEDSPKFFGELIGLLNTFGKYNIKVIQCDSKVHSVEDYDENVMFDSKNITRTGGGGTSFNPPFEYLKDNGIEPDCFIYFTDGFGDVMDTPPKYPVLWLITNKGYMDFCKWGRKIQFKEN